MSRSYIQVWNWTLVSCLPHPPPSPGAGIGGSWLVEFSSFPLFNWKHSSDSVFFKKKKFKYLCIYLLLHWVFVVRVAFLWLQSGDSSRVVLRLLIAVASLVEQEL